MPSYDYRCVKCARHYEINHSIFDTEERRCEVDNASLLRIPNAVPAHFKGGGWGGQ